MTVGTCCLVLHSHLPWLAGHGSWPVGEEWLYQAWSQAYLPVVRVLERLAAEGRRDLLTLGVTPVLAAQLDDPYTLGQMHTWLGFRQVRVVYRDAGVAWFVVDGPTLRAAGRSTSAAWHIGTSDVAAFARDDELTYRVWSPRHGYPTGADYRDFHTYDHASGLKPARVTSVDTPPEAKAPYQVEPATAAALHDADEFVVAVRAQLEAIAQRDGRAGLAVVACDTELFGHWWHEGPVFLERVLRRLPEAGVRVATLRAAVDGGHVAGRADLPPGSWGSGKDFRAWSGEQVADLVELGTRVQHDLLAAVDGALAPGDVRRPDLDEVARQAMLALSSDWAFMVSHDSAADYARGRAYGHAAAFDRARRAVGTRPDGTPPEAAPRPFAQLDARLLAAQ